MEKRRQNMDVNIKSLSCQEFLQNKIRHFLSDYPTIIVFLESAPLFHWHLTKNMHSSHFLYFLFFYPHTFSPWSPFRVQSMQGFKVADMTFHWDLFASTHNLFVNTSLVTNSPFVKVHGYKCYLTSHFTQITVILWWEKPRLGISRFQSLIICFEQIVLKSSLIRVWTSKRLKRLRVYYANPTG